MHGVTRSPPTTIAKTAIGTWAIVVQIPASRRKTSSVVSLRNTLVMTQKANFLWIDQPFPRAVLSTIQIDWVTGGVMSMETTTQLIAIGILATAVPKLASKLNGTNLTSATITMRLVVKIPKCRVDPMSQPIVRWTIPNGWVMGTAITATETTTRPPAIGILEIVALVLAKTRHGSNPIPVALKHILARIPMAM